MGKVPIVPPLSGSQIEKAADKILKEFCPQIWRSREPVPVDGIFEIYIPQKLGLRTAYTMLQNLGINAEGYTNARQKISLVDKNLADDYSQRGTRRFRATTGHETGHCVLHVPLQGRWQKSLQLVGLGMKREQSDLKPMEDPEWQAWRFCQALCMPASLVRHMVSQFGVDYHGVTMTKERFNMSRSFVMARLKSLKINSAGSYQRKKRVK